MQVIDNLKIRYKLAGSFAVMLIIILLMFVVGYISLQSMKTSLGSMYIDSTLSTASVSSMGSTLERLQGIIFQYLLFSGQRDNLKKKFQLSEANLEQTLGNYSKENMKPEESQALTSFQIAWQGYRTAIEEDVFRKVEGGDMQSAFKSLNEGGRAYNAREIAIASVDKLIVLNTQNGQEMDRRGVATYARAWNILSTSTLAGIILAILMGTLITLGLDKPLATLTANVYDLSIGILNRDECEKGRQALLRRKDEIGLLSRRVSDSEVYLLEMAEMAGKIAQGDLTVKVTPRSEKDELGHAFADMVAGLHLVVSEVAESAMKVSAASQQLAVTSLQAGQATGQIAETIQQVALGISQQSESVSYTASSVEIMAHAIQSVANGAQEQAAAVNRASGLTGQISNIITQVANNAQTVVNESAGAAEHARNGSKTVNETIQGMQLIKEKVGLSAQKVEEMGRRSSQIGSIGETIEEIASQTNLLALNAAIEAARAGEHGKGFAVVADEVRKLAERSSLATKEISGLVKGIQDTVTEAVAAMQAGGQEVDKGMAKANQAGEALKSILTATETAASRATHTSGAAEKMNAASAELVSSMDTVSAVVEENTASTEEMSAASDEVTRDIENIRSVSEENSAAVEMVNAAAEEMSAQVTEVTASAKGLLEMADVLQDVVAQFKLKLDDDQEDRSTIDVEPGPLPRDQSDIRALEVGLPILEN